ncbi:sensor histidine kinase [Actinoplanes sp. GCM10030250]|uniref:sensor histidine kinase n=1 Tax=Actinoplanes sp. GCM10030250 TaxID=3273376 RepID=UPI003613F6B7
MRLREFRALAGRHPRVVDAGVAAALAAFCGLVLTGQTGATVTPANALDWASVVLVPVPLIWRRGAPGRAFLATIALLWISAGTGAQSPAAFLVSLVALHAVARYHPARYVWPATALCVLPALENRPAEGPAWGAFFAVAAATTAAALTGVNQRTRAAYLQELEDRARRLEQDRDQRARLAVAEERARIAREMHDVVAHHLAVMVALSDGAAAIEPAAPQRAAAVMIQVSATGRQALSEMRRLVGLLRTSSRTGDAGRAPQPGLDDIDALVERMREAGVRVSLVREGAPGDWGPAACLTVYRIVQEALTNILKHAGPHATAEVALRYSADGADVSVVDDGAGRVAGRPEPGDRHGLAGMLERAGAYAGHLDAGPRTGPGWQVHARLHFGAT